MNNRSQYEMVVRLELEPIEVDKIMGRRGVSFMLSGGDELDYRVKGKVEKIYPTYGAQAVTTNFPNGQS